VLYAAFNGPDRHGMSGPERAMLYRLVGETGMRVSELRRLLCASFHLHGEEPTVTILPGYNTKRRQEVEMSLRRNTAAELQAIFSTKRPMAPVFDMPSKHRVIDMLRADLEAAEIPYSIDSKHGMVVDFHSFRHSTSSWLAAAGVHPKGIQRVMRHSTITLTLDRYTHAFKSDEVAAIAALPDISLLRRLRAKATGTDPAAETRGALRGARGGQKLPARWTHIDARGAGCCRRADLQYPVNTADLTMGQRLTKINGPSAGVAKLADATDSKSVPW